MQTYNTSEGGKFTYPESLADVTLKQYIDFLNFVEPTKPQELVNIQSAYYEYYEAEEKDAEVYKAKYEAEIDKLTDRVMIKKVYPYYARVVSFFAEGITEQQILGGKKHGDGMNLGHLQFLYSRIVEILNNIQEPEYSNVILVDNELWYLPLRYMEKAKLIEYAEASQFEANMKDLEHGNWLALPKIMCVLVRKEGEMYSDSLMKREEMFMNWSLENCLRVSFFLLKRSEISILSLRAFTQAQDLGRLKLESNDLMSSSVGT
jgi:hypothetical protein